MLHNLQNQFYFSVKIYSVHILLYSLRKGKFLFLEYGQLQPFPDPPFQPQYQGTPQTFQSQDNLLSQPLQPFTPGFPQPNFQTAVEPDVQPAFQPAFQPAAQPAVQPEIQPAIQPEVQPVVQPAAPVI